MGTTWIAPSLLLSLLLSVGYAALFHLWRGRSLGDLLLYLLVSAVGFGAGQLAGTLLRTPLLQIGEVHLVEATIGAFVALGIATLLTTPLTRRA